MAEWVWSVVVGILIFLTLFPFAYIVLYLAITGFVEDWRDWRAMRRARRCPDCRRRMRDR